MIVERSTYYYTDGDIHSIDNNGYITRWGKPYPGFQARSIATDKDGFVWVVNEQGTEAWFGMINRRVGLRWFKFIDQNMSWMRGLSIKEVRAGFGCECHEYDYYQKKQVVFLVTNNYAEWFVLAEEDMIGWAIGYPRNWMEKTTAFALSRVDDFRINQIRVNWFIENNKTIYTYSASQNGPRVIEAMDGLPSGRSYQDIAVQPNSIENQNDTRIKTVLITRNNSLYGGSIYKYNIQSRRWELRSGLAIKAAVDRNGRVWVINNEGKIFFSDSF